nr:methyltransferase [Streptomyces sp. HNM0575]
MGAMAAQTLATGLRLGVFEAFRDEPRTAQDVAVECGTLPQPTLRLLRALAGLGLLREDSPGRFAATGEGAVLREDRPDSIASFVHVFTDPAMLRGWDRLDDSVRTGETSFDAVFGKDFFTHLKENPGLSARFNAAMSQGTRSTAELLPKHYDFTGFQRVVDVGGGDGTLLSAVLRAQPGLHGVLFDSAEGLAQAGAVLQDGGVADRCTLETGDFFRSVPAGGDLYMLKSIIHDWNDAQCATVLGHCREAMTEDGRLLIIEPVMPDTVPHEGVAPPYLSDLNMLVNVGGRERTRDDFAALCREAGFAAPTVTVLPGNGFSLIHAAPLR